MSNRANRLPRWFRALARSVLVASTLELVDDRDDALAHLGPLSGLHQAFTVGLVPQAGIGIEADEHRADYLVVGDAERRVLHAAGIESQPIVAALAVREDPKSVTIKGDPAGLVEQQSGRALGAAKASRSQTAKVDFKGSAVGRDLPPGTSMRDRLDWDVADPDLEVPIPSVAVDRPVRR